MRCALTQAGPEILVYAKNFKKRATGKTELSAISTIVLTSVMWIKITYITIRQNIFFFSILYSVFLDFCECEVNEMVDNVLSVVETEQLAAPFFTQIISSLLCQNTEVDRYICSGHVSMSPTFKLQHVKFI